MGECVEIDAAVRGLAAGIAAVEREGFRLRVGDEPHGMIGLAQSLDHRLAHRLVSLQALMLFRDVGDEDVVDPAVGIGIGIVAVVVHPAHRAVPADDPVLRVVHLGLVALDLLLDGFGHVFEIVGMEHPLEGVACQGPELLRVPATEDAVHRVIGVQQLPRAVVLIDEEAARHVFAELFNDLEGLAVELKFFCEHGRFSSA